MAYRDYGSMYGLRWTSWVKRLIIANVAVFILTMVIRSLWVYLALIPSRILVQPWGAVTYMFVHGDFFHLLFNMLVVFFFGPPLEERWGGREFVKFYLICGLGAAALSFLTPNAAVVGASGATFGLMVAYAMYWPNNQIYIWGIFPVKAKWLVTFLVLFNLLSIGGASNIAYLAHVGGAVAAFVYLRSPWSPSAWGAVPRPARPGGKGWNPFKREPRAQSTSVRPAKPNRAAARHEVHSLDEVDRILDKISTQGIDSLTAEERQLLDEASRRHRSN